MSRFFLFVLLLAAVGFVSPVMAEDWQQFRGPAANGVSNEINVPAEWNAETNIRWQVGVPGSGWSAPLVTHGKVILTTAVSTDPEDKEAAQRFEVHCLDLASGKTIWQRVAVEGKPRQPKHVDNTYASETPITDGEHIVAYFGGAGVFCYDFAGQLLWQKDVGAYPMQGDWGTSSSLALDRGLVYLQVDNEEKSFLVALDATSGNEKWRVDRDEKTTWCSPIIWKNKARTELVTGGKSIRSYDPQTGELLWELAVGERASSASPAGNEEMLIVGARGLFAVRAGAKGDITPKDGEKTSDGLIWANEAGGPSMASPLIYKDFLYILDRRGGLFSCYEAATGKQLYKERLPNSREFWASPWASGGKIFCTDDSGATHVIAPGAEFKLIGTNQLEGRFWASSAIADSSLLLRSADKLFCVRYPGPTAIQATRPDTPGPRARR